MTRELQNRAASNRARFPELAKWFDEMNAVFPGSRMRYVRGPDGYEKGQSIGEGAVFQPSPDCVGSMSRKQG